MSDNLSRVIIMKNSSPMTEHLANGIRRTRKLSPLVSALAAVFAVAQVASASNLLLNPLFNLTPAKTGWTTFGNTPLVGTGATYYNAGACPPDAPAESVSFYPP